MRFAMIGLLFTILWVNNSYAAARSITLVATPAEVVVGASVHLQCTATGDWLLPLVSAKVTIKNTSGTSVVSGQTLTLSGTTAGYDYLVPANAAAGNWTYSCEVRDRKTRVTRSSTFKVATFAISPIAAHNTITKYDGPVTCLSCHSTEGTEMVNSLHAKWKAPTPELTNTKGEELGKWFPRGNRIAQVLAVLIMFLILLLTVLGAIPN